MNEELKMRPFCGGRAKLYHCGGGTVVSCEECEVETPMFPNAEDAIEAWNRRVNEWTKN